MFYISFFFNTVYLSWSIKLTDNLENFMYDNIFLKFKKYNKRIKLCQDNMNNYMN